MEKGKIPYPLPFDFNIQLGKKFYKIKSRDYLRISKSYSEISPGNETGFSEATIIKPSPDIFYQVRIGVDNNVRVKMKQPAAITKFGTDQKPEGFIDNNVSPKNYPSEESEIYVAPETAPQINIENPSENLVDITPTLYFVGYKYEVEELKKKPAQILKLPTEAFGG